MHGAPVFTCGDGGEQSFRRTPAAAAADFTGMEDSQWVSMTFSRERTALALGLCSRTDFGSGSSWAEQKHDFTSQQADFRNEAS